MARKGKKKTAIVTTKKAPGGVSKGNKFAKRLTKKVHRKHSGYSMKNITKGQMTYKRKGRKR
jgi:hypothetical protein